MAWEDRLLTESQATVPSHLNQQHLRARGKGEGEVLQVLQHLSRFSNKFPILIRVRLHKSRGQLHLDNSSRGLASETSWQSFRQMRCQTT